MRSKLLTLILIISTTLLTPFYTFASSTSIEASGDEVNNTIPHIPEPMVFDLVRPLGDKKNNIETNTLLNPPTTKHNNNFRWAPEIEYEFSDGYGIEFEFPFADSDFEEYKIALQGTLGTFNNKKSIHGLQLITKYKLDDKKIDGDLLYLVGHRFNNRWSSFIMKGLGSNIRDHSRTTNGILNTSIFYDINKKLVLGFETNSRYNKNRWNQVTLIPQAHIQLNKKSKLQIGLGIEKNFTKRFYPYASARIIREF